MIAQLVHTLNYGDAISTEVLALDRVFREAGQESQVYSINTHPKYNGKTVDYREFPPNFSGEVILHYSLGSPLNALYRSLTNASRTLIYHNITPSDWFRGVNPRVARDIDVGIEELPGLCSISDRLLADSQFNSKELSAINFKAEILPLMFDTHRWNLPANSGIAALLNSDPSMHVVHVGRLAPNKKIEDIIKAFYFLHHHIEPKSRLWLAGIDIDTELYSFSLKRLIAEFSLTDCVSFCGPMNDDEIRALYENGSVYICMSEHEGFCLPLVEAMHFGLPVCAFASSAVPETLGNGGVLFEDKDPAMVAALLYKVAKEAPLRERLIAAGRARSEQFSFENFRARTTEIFLGQSAKKLAAGAR